MPKDRTPVHRHLVHRHAGPPSPTSPTAGSVIIENKTLSPYLRSHST
jgi:hypothetical protein